MHFLFLDRVEHGLLRFIIGKISDLSENDLGKIWLTQFVDPSSITPEAIFQMDWYLFPCEIFWAECSKTLKPTLHSQLGRFIENAGGSEEIDV